MRWEEIMLRFFGIRKPPAEVATSKDRAREERQRRIKRDLEEMGVIVMAHDLDRRRGPSTWPPRMERRAS